MERGLITGLDIGTTTVSAVIGEMDENNEFLVLGVGQSPSNGIRKGIIVNIDSTTEAILKAVEEAELMAGITVSSLYVSITGSHIESKNSRGVIAVSNKSREITDKEISRAIEAAQTINLPLDREIVHVIPWEFIVDDQDNVKDPVGMTGIRFEVNTHIVTASTTVLQNITKSVNRAGFKIENIVLSALASAEAVLTDEERELGVLLIDIGGGTTDVLISYNGSTRYSKILPIGGKHITKDLSVGLRIPDNTAEYVKLNYNLYKMPSEEIEMEDEEIEIPAVGGRSRIKVLRDSVTDIISPRLEEMLLLVYNDIRRNGMLDYINGGIVLTGGSSLLSGIEMIAENIFNLPVRTAPPNLSGGLKDKIASPSYSTAAGLVIYGFKNEDAGVVGSQYKNGILRRVKTSISEFAKDFFS